ncbi:glycosyltransferase family 4 protein [Miniphocaeibacter massiliensis]|uniref:glycosyltransferase family 4 protein n=1 Tax=Miniphocaeibacter massiliensis TaxID=2041841 RepID=UPI000C1BC7BC|nr:glycosyltransferase family 4 protein [Miniphocaeibacter massiliensis]
MKDKALEVCSYYMGTSLYKNLFDQFTDKKVDHDILYFCSRPTVLKKDIPENFIVSQPYEPIDRLFFFRKHRKVYEDIQEKVDFDKYYLTHAHSLVSNGYISLKIKENYGIPYIVAVRNTDLFVFLKHYPFIKNTARKILDEAENVIFLSPAYRDITINKYVKKENRKKIEEKSFILPNGIDKYFLDNRKVKIRESDKKINLVYVGRVDDLNKNVLTSVKACKILIEQGYDIKFTVVGRLENSLFKKVLLKNKFVHHVPSTDKEGVRKVLDSNDIFLMPSKRETFGLVYVEAMSQGLPVIYTKGQGFDGHFKEGYVGYHVVYNNANDISERVKDILNNYNEMSKNASEEAMKFNWKEISNKYIDIYNNIRNEKI